MLFHLRRPHAAAVDSAVASASMENGGSTSLISLAEGAGGRKLPSGYVHDSLRSRLGVGQAAFLAARRGFAQWAEFDLGWVRVANPETLIAPGQVVAVEVNVFGLWSLNLSRIVEVIDTETCFGFVYATTAHHAEQGDERFVLELDPTDGGVCYHLEAVSRPRHPLARAAYPLTRALQHRFARDSHERMRRAVL